VVTSKEIPSPFHDLLVHEQHMTATLEAYCGRPMRLRVLDHQQVEDVYRRKIVLTPADDDTVVELGVVRINLHFAPESVRKEILERRTPLGDILIRHDVLRRIEPRWYLRFPAEGSLAAGFGYAPPTPRAELYGRIGTIHCNHRPAIELLEIVTGAGQANR
jgi:chorismate-pyruvate lyase